MQLAIRHSVAQQVARLRAAASRKQGVPVSAPRREKEMRSPAPFSGVVHPGSRRFITPARRSLPWCCLDFVCLPWARTTALLNRPPSNIPPDAGRGQAGQLHLPRAPLACGAAISRRIVAPHWSSIRLTAKILRLAIRYDVPQRVAGSDGKLLASGSPPLIPKHGPACERRCLKPASSRNWAST